MVKLATCQFSEFSGTNLQFRGHVATGLQGHAPLGPGSGPKLCEDCNLRLGFAKRTNFCERWVWVKKFGAHSEWLLEDGLG